MRNKYLFTSVALILLLSVLGCSNANNPITSADAPTGRPAYDYLPVGVIDYLLDGNISSGMGILGLFQMHLDPSNINGELTSLRRSSLTDVLEVVDITNFLQLAPCTDCVKLKSISLDSDSHLVVSIGIKHPFDAGNPLKPVTGRNRADLHVFNVEGIVVSDATGTSFPGLGEKISGLKLLSADGFTGYLDDSLDEIFSTDATIHPYVLHFDDYSVGNFDAGNPMGFQSVTKPPPSGNLVMAMGCDYNYQDYVFDLDSPVDLIFAVGCTYAVSAATKQARFNPEYRIPQHNKKAASEVRLEIISNDLKGEDAASTAQIEVNVVDISHGIPVGDALNEMLADSSVKDIRIDVPCVMSSVLVIDGSSSISGTGHNLSDPLIYEGTITNSAGALEGSYAGLVKVTDNYAPGKNGFPLLDGMDGIKRVDPTDNPLEGLFEIAEFATYQVFSIDVARNKHLEVASITPDQAYQHELVNDAIITGTDFIDVISVRLEMAPEVIEADNFLVDSETQITADFDIGGHQFGLYDVVVEVQGSETAALADGFEVLLKCGTTAPEFDSVYTLNPTINTSYLSTILTGGPYEGYTIFHECNIMSGGYRVFDHTVQADNTPVINWPSFQAWGNPLVMEAANENDLIIICSAYFREYWLVLSQTTGALKQTLTIGYQSGTVGDFDGNDDFWDIAVNCPDPSSYPNVYEYFLQHWAYNPGNPSTPYTLAGQQDVTSLFRDDMSIDYKWEVFGDLVMDPSADYCFVLTGEQGTDPHKVDKVDLTGPSPTIVASYSFAGEGLDTDGQIDTAQSRSVKMELDTSDPDYIPCRLVVAGSKYTPSQYYMNIYRFDTDLRFLGSSSKPYNITSGSWANKFWGMGLDMENGLICHLTELTWSDPLAYYGISKLPTDW